MNIIQYFKERRWRDKTVKLFEDHKQLAELARGTAREGYIVLALMLRHPYCSCCAEGERRTPMRVPWGGTQICTLLCERCSKQLCENSVGHGRVLKQLKELIATGIYEMAYLFQHGPRIRIVWGGNLGHEVLQ